MSLRSIPALLVAAGATVAHASVTHVFDDFSAHPAGNHNSPPGLDGRIPSVSTNGAAWRTMGWGNSAGVWSGGSPTNQFGVLWGASTIGSAAVDIRSAQRWAQPFRFVTISAKVAYGAPNVGSGDGNAAIGGGVRLGFWSGVGDHAWDLFSGVVMGHGGELNVVSDPSPQGLNEDWVLGTPVSFVGTFNRFQLRTLSMTIDTMLGSITDISLEGSSANYSSLYGTQVFTVANTRYAGVSQQNPYNYTANSFDDFTVSSVPAPGAIALLGLAGLAGRRRR